MTFQHSQPATVALKFRPIHHYRISLQIFPQSSATRRSSSCSSFSNTLRHRIRQHRWRRRSLFVDRIRIHFQWVLKKILKRILINFWIFCRVEHFYSNPTSRWRSAGRLHAQKSATTMPFLIVKFCRVIMRNFGMRRENSTWRWVGSLMGVFLCDVIVFFWVH